MSRFRNALFTKDKSDAPGRSATPEDLPTILRKREERLNVSAPCTPRKSTNIASIPLSSSSAPPFCEDDIFWNRKKKSVSSTDLFEDGGTNSVSSHIGRTMPNALTLSAESDTLSYKSHTSRSIQEASAVLEEVDRRRSKSPDTSLRSISQMMAKVRSIPPSSISSPSNKPREAQPSHVCNQVDTSTESSLPDTTRMSNLPRSRAVAAGYISPPQSRHTSPIYTMDRPHLDLLGTLNRSLNTSSPSSKADNISQQCEEVSVLSNNHSSPRSRLTRTLIEIQQELANSREGIEQIESRLGTLETNSITNPQQVKKQVQDYLRSLVEGSESASDSVSEDSLLDLHDDHVLAAAEEASTGGAASFVRLPAVPVRRHWMTMTFVLYSCLGILAAEYFAVTLISELARGQNVF